MPQRRGNDDGPWRPFIDAGWRTFGNPVGPVEWVDETDSRDEHAQRTLRLLSVLLPVRILSLTPIGGTAVPAYWHRRLEKTITRGK